MTPLLIAALVAGAPANAQEWARGEAIDDGIAVGLTEEGLSALGSVAGAVVPGNLPIDPISDSADNGFCLISYAYSLDNMWVGIEIVDFALVPQDGFLDLDVDLDIWVNEPGDEFVISYDALCLDDSCVGYIDPFPVNVQAPISMTVTDPLQPDKPIEVTIGNLNLTLPPSLGSYIQMQSGCLADVEDILNLAGLSLYGLITDLVTPFLLDFVAGYGSELEGTLEDALVAVNFEDQFDLLGTTLYVHLYPSDIVTTTDGLEIVMASEITADQGECMEDLGWTGSLKTDTPRPTIASQPPGTQMALHVSDDMVNQALFSITDSGLLCFTLPDETGAAPIDVPIPLNTSLLGILAGDAFDELFPETQDLIIQTEPNEALMVDLESGHDLEIDARGLDLNFYAELDYRMARALGLTLEADVGMDVNFDGTTGDLAIDIDLSEGAIRTLADNNELVPDANADIEANFDGLLSTIIDSLAGDALSGLSFSLPSADGVGLQSLEFETTGAQNDWLTGRAELGPVPYGIGEGCDCSGDGGCGGGGSGSTGCASASGPLGIAGFLLPLLLLRRRNS